MQSRSESDALNERDSGAGGRTHCGFRDREQSERLFYFIVSIQLSQELNGESC